MLPDWFILKVNIIRFLVEERDIALVLGDC